MQSCPCRRPVPSDLGSPRPATRCPGVPSPTSPTFAPPGAARRPGPRASLCAPPSQHTNQAQAQMVLVIATVESG